MKVEFLIVCQPDRANEIVNTTFLRELLQRVLADNLDEFDESALSDSITLTLRREVLKRDGSEEVARVVCGFEVNLPEETTYPQDVITQLADALAGQDGVLHLLKLYDDLLLENNLKLAREVFMLEMSLRKALSLIYLTEYENDFYNLLREDQVQIAKKDGKKPEPKEMEEIRENEFFHLLFSQYITLNQRRKLAEVKTILELVQQADNFDTFKSELSRLPISDEKDGDFITSLKALVSSIEELRNCVAHNREPSEKALTNYTNSRDNLKEQLKAFFDRFNLKEE